MNEQKNKQTNDASRLNEFLEQIRRKVGTEGGTETERETYNVHEEKSDRGVLSDNGARERAAKASE